jgi:hypothetical protein
VTANLLAQTVAEIAERERRVAVKERDYLRALICAIVEDQARQVAG